MYQALKRIDLLISVLTNNNKLISVISPERTLYEYIQKHLSSSCKGYIMLKELHDLTKKSFLQRIHHSRCINKSKPKHKEMSVDEIIQSLCGIDGMDINFPWKIRDKKFIDFIKSIPGIIIQFDDSCNSYKICIDNKVNIKPFLNMIDRLPLNENIGYLLSNHIRKNSKYKFMKQNVNIYKQSLEICKLLQNIHFSIKNSNIWNKIFIQNLNPSYSMSLQSVFERIGLQNNNDCQYEMISALQLLLYFESENNLLNDLSLSFYKKNSNENVSSLNNINWYKMPEMIEPKWLLKRSNKSLKNAIKSIKWKEFQIETFYEILKSLCSSISKLKNMNNERLKIVDFGSGAGNVSLCIAFLFPMHDIICIEYEISRIDLAKQRAKESGINNIYFICDYIQNINISFDIGIAVHLCGIATDYAQIQCFKNNASFILCSCCNGKCCNQLNRKNKKPMDNEEDIISKFVQFPRSKYLKQSMNDNSFHIFSKLTLFSDFNFDDKIFEENKMDKKQYDNYCRYNIKRKFCKILCEIDRCLSALEIKQNGYNKVILTQINPNNTLFQSSPKSDVIIGIHSRHCNQ